MPRISSKHQITLPVEVMRAAGLSAGDEVAIDLENGDEVRIRRSPARLEDAIGIFDGLYEPGYLERLREDWD